MNNEKDPPVGAPVDPVTHPVVTDNPSPTEPQGAPDPPEQPDPYPVSDPPLPTEEPVEPLASQK